eukprot:365587-Chlamydomonas_euryale.AAC.3
MKVEAKFTKALVARRPGVGDLGGPPGAHGARAVHRRRGCMARRAGAASAWGGRSAGAGGAGQWRCLRVVGPTRLREG